MWFSKETLTCVALFLNSCLWFYFNVYTIQGFNHLVNFSNPWASRQPIKSRVQGCFCVFITFDPCYIYIRIGNYPNGSEGGDEKKS